MTMSAAPSGDHARSCVIQNQSHPEFFCQIQYQRQYLGLDRDISAGSARRDHSAGRHASAHRDHRALALPPKLV